MVEQQQQQLDAVFGALADPTRRRILRQLSVGALTVGEIAEPFQMSLAAVSKHLKVLEKAQLIKRQIDGRQHHVQLNAKRLSSALEWLRFYEQFWTQRLDALERALGKPQRTTKTRS
ncbi:MAG: metalloregulator ArsR/SmtB family transcription factor [Acidobacteriota bacterium]